jgi:3-dehydroquinate synthase
VVTIRVALVEQRDASYDILIAPGLVRRMDKILPQYVPAAAYAVISDSHVGEVYGEPLVALLHEAGIQAELFTFPAGESHKTRETWASLSDRMLAAHLGRDSTVIALGGGVVNDVGGFVAATYLRGVPLVQVPTTLLAMIDSSIGGKTGVDVPAGKNLLGAFHQPRVVVADPELLGSLSSVQLAAGLAEAVKHGVIADSEYFAFLEREYAAIFAKHAPALERVVRRSVEIKAAVVGQDEREKGEAGDSEFRSHGGARDRSHIELRRAAWRSGGDRHGLRVENRGRTRNRRDGNSETHQNGLGAAQSPRRATRCESDRRPDRVDAG